VCHDARAHGVPIARADHNHALDLPHLEQVLQHFAKHAFLDIELKVPGLESKTLALLGAHSPQCGYVVSSFLPGVVAELRGSSPDAPLGIICEKPGQLARWRELPVQYVIVHKSLLTPNLVEHVHVAGRKVFAWTVNDQPTMLQLAEWEVDGIISDDTRLLARTLGKIKSRQS
jgi:glycerophosphoryl diester phosphodiesterase